MFRAQQNHFDDAVGKLHQSLLRQIHCALLELALLKRSSQEHIESACVMCLLTIFIPV